MLSCWWRQLVELTACHTQGLHGLHREAGAPVCLREATSSDAIRRATPDGAPPRRLGRATRKVQAEFVNRHTRCQEDV